MARYGRDFDRNRGGMRSNRGGMGRGYGMDYGYGAGGAGSEGMYGGGGYGGMGSEGYGQGYGGMGSDAFGGEGWGSQARRGYSGFGTGGGAYDTEYGGGMGYGGYGTQGGGYAGGYGSGMGYRGGRGTTGGFRGEEYGYGGGTGFGGGTQGGYGGGFSEYGQGGYGGGMGQSRGGTQTRMRASDLMTENPETVTPEATLADVAKKMRDLNVGIIPVVESEQSMRLRGVVTDRDIAIRAVAEGKDTKNTKVSDVMTTDVETCNKNDSVEDVLHVMESEQVRRVPITDREGRLVGIIAEADVLTDYAEGDHEREHRVEDTLERVYEPGQPRRGGMRGSQNRGMQAGGSQAGGTLDRGQTDTSSTRGGQQRGTQTNQ